MRACIIRKNDEQVNTSLRPKAGVAPQLILSHHTARHMACTDINHQPRQKNTRSRRPSSARRYEQKRYASVFGCTSKNENNVYEACADQTDRTPCLVADLLLLLLRPTSHQHQLQHWYRYRVRNKQTLLAPTRLGLFTTWLKLRSFSRGRRSFVSHAFSFRVRRKKKRVTFQN